MNFLLFVVGRTLCSVLCSLVMEIENLLSIFFTLGNIDFGYSDKVLVGNWLERRRKDIVNREMDLRTQYMVDYTQKSADRNVNSAWDNRLHGQGSIQLKQGDNEEVPSNMATVYDLAYRCRVKDFVTGDYENVTNYGKKECFQKYWDAQADDKKLRFHTEYKDNFSFTPCLGHVLSN